MHRIALGRGTHGSGDQFDEIMQTLGSFAGVLAVLFLYAIYVIATSLIDAAYDLIYLQSIGIQSVVHFVMIFLGSYVAYETWTYGATLGNIAFRHLRLMVFILLLYLLTILLLSTFAIYLRPDAVSSNTVILESNIAFDAIYLLYVFYVLRSLLSQKIEGIPDTLDRLLIESNYHTVVAPSEAKSIVRIDQPRGFLWVFAGMSLSFVGAGAGYVITHAVGLSLGNPIGFLFVVIGAWCILKGRTFFTQTQRPSWPSINDRRFCI